MFTEYCNKYGDLDKNNLAYMAITLDKKTKNNILLAIKYGRKFSDNMALSAIYQAHFKEHDFFEFMNDLREIYNNEISHYFEKFERKKSKLSEIIDSYKIKINDELIYKILLSNKTMEFLNILKKAKESMDPFKKSAKEKSVSQKMLEKCVESFDFSI